MSKFALLSVDLNSVNETQRQKFYDKIKELKWNKVTTLTTIWKLSFTDTSDDSGIIKKAKQDVVNAAALASIASYDAIVHVGPGEPVQF